MFRIAMDTCVEKVREAMDAGLANEEDGERDFMAVLHTLFKAFRLELSFGWTATRIVCLSEATPSEVALAVQRAGAVCEEWIRAGNSPLVKALVFADKGSSHAVTETTTFSSKDFGYWNGFFGDLDTCLVRSCVFVIIMRFLLKSGNSVRFNGACVLRVEIVKSNATVAHDILVVHSTGGSTLIPPAQGHTCAACLLDTGNWCYLELSPGQIYPGSDKGCLMWTENVPPIEVCSSDQQIANLLWASVSQHHERHLQLLKMQLMAIDNELEVNATAWFEQLLGSEQEKHLQNII